MNGWDNKGIYYGVCGCKTVLLGLAFGILTVVVSAGVYSVLYRREHRRWPRSRWFFIGEGAVIPVLNGITLSHTVWSSLSLWTVCIAGVAGLLAGSLYVRYDGSFDVGRRVSPAALHQLFFVVLEGFYVVITVAAMIASYIDLII